LKIPYSLRVCVHVFANSNTSPQNFAANVAEAQLVGERAISHGVFMNGVARIHNRGWVEKSIDGTVEGRMVQGGKRIPEIVGKEEGSGSEIWHTATMRNAAQI
jgi:hypothetical protein